MKIITIVTLVLSCVFSPRSAAQITIDGFFNESEYSLLLSRLNNNNGFAPDCEFTAIYFSRSELNLYLGFECRIQNVPNYYNAKPDGLGIFLNYSTQQGKDAGQPLGIDSSFDFHFLNGGIENFPQSTLEFKADFEVDYLFAVYSNSTPNQIYVDAVTHVAGHQLTIQNLGITDQNGNSVTGPAEDGVFSADSVEFAFIPSQFEGSKTGFEIKIPLSEFNAAQNDWFQLFAAIVASTAYFSDQTIPGNVLSGNSGWAPDYYNNLTNSDCYCPIPNNPIGIAPFHTGRIGPITVLSPNGFETWKYNSEKEIKWISNNIENVKIEFTSDGDTTWITIADSISAAAGNYNWLTPDIYSSFCRIRISNVADSSIFDISDSFFTIGKLTTENEPNNSTEQANQIYIGDSLDASINPTGDIDYFKFAADANDTIVISIQDINSSELYGRLDLSDGSGTIWATLYFDPWRHYQTYYVVPSSGSNFIRISTAFGFTGSGFPKSIKNSLEIQKRKDTNNAMAETGDYRIFLRKFIPSSPAINSINILDTYYNKTGIYVELYPNGLYTRMKIEYGTTTSYENEITIPDSVTGIYSNWLWTKITGLVPNTYYYVRAEAENDSGIYYSQNYNFITPEEPEFWGIKSIDSLSHWPWFNDVSFANENIGFIVGVSADYLAQNIIMKTTNSGDSWIVQDINNYLSKILCIDTLNVVALTDYGILKSTNGGISWLFSQTPNSGYLDLFFLDANNGFVVGSNGTIIKTTNGGVNWTEQTSGTFYYLYSVFFTDSSTGWISGEYGTILKTTDGGINWNPLNSGAVTLLGDIYFVDSENGYAISPFEGAVYKSTDGGNSWNYQFSGTYNLKDISFVDKNNGIVIGGYQGEISLTTDAGATWALQKNGTYNNLIAVSRAGYNWVAVGDFGTILKSTYNLVSVEEEDQIPASFELGQNYPNPFNPSTKIIYQIPEANLVTLKVYDVLGSELATLVNEEKSTGSYEVEFIASALSSGIYFYRLQAGKFTETKKLVLLK